MCMMDRWVRVTSKEFNVTSRPANKGERLRAKFERCGVEEWKGKWASRKQTQ